MEKENADGYEAFLSDGELLDRLDVNDHFIGDILSSASSLIDTNPETVEKWTNSICEDYNIPLLKWSGALDNWYKSNKHFMSSLEILKQINNDSEDE